MISKQRIEKIKKKYNDIFVILEDYDKTHKLPFQRKRLDITLSLRIIKILTELSKKTGKPVSRIIEEMVSKVA